MPDVMLPSLTDGFTRDRVLPSEMAEDGQLVIEKPLSFRAAMPAETLAFETANDGLGALKRAARSFFGSVTKRWIGGGEDAFISLDDGHSCEIMGFGAWKVNQSSDQRDPAGTAAKLPVRP